MHDAQGKLDFVRASRDTRIDALPVPDRVKLLFRAIDRIALLMVEAGSSSAFIDDGQVLVAEIEVTQIMRLTNKSESTIRRAIRDARRTPHLHVDEARGNVSVYCLYWETIPPVTGVPPDRGVTVTGVSPAADRGVTSKTGGKPGDRGGVSPPHETHEFENQRFKSQHSVEGAGDTPVTTGEIRNDVVRRARRWSWTRDQLAAADFVDMVIIPAAIARFELAGAEADRLGLQAAACCAAAKGAAAGALFTDFVKRRAWTERGRGGIAERWFDEALALRAPQDRSGSYEDQLQEANDERREEARRKQEMLAGLRDFEREWHDQRSLETTDT